MRTLIEKRCELCGKPYRVKPHRAKTSHFCSRSCGAKYHLTVCRPGKYRPFQKGNQHAKGRHTSGCFTSERVRGRNNVNWVEKLKFVCSFCQKEFERPPHIAYKVGVTNEFCSTRCRSRYRSVYKSGPNAPDWKGGKTTYRGEDWPFARAIVIIDQKGEGKHCGKFLGKRMPVHHIVPFRMFATSQEANQRANLIGLCQKCHMKEEYKDTRKTR